MEDDDHISNLFITYIVEGHIIDQQKKQQGVKQVNITALAPTALAATPPHHQRCIVPVASSLQTFSTESIISQ
ncbi:unnamed protein product, partial [Litomosoides sigmodontis]